MFFCSSFQSYSLVYCSVLSVSVTASVLYLIPSSSHSLPLFICFPPPSFITPKKKKKKKRRVLWRYSEGADECWQRRCGEMKRDGAQGKGEREGEREREYDTMFGCNANRQILVLCERDWRATQNKGVIVKATLQSWSFVACQSTRTRGIGGSHSKYTSIFTN